MRALIIEDEDFAAQRLENMILRYDSTIQILAKLPSVKEAVHWLQNNSQPELIFLDIQLDDDISFSIFDQVKVRSQIIFTTAFDEYAIRAFKQRSIDYLLKPINQKELVQAIEKYKEWNKDREVVFDPRELQNLLVPNQKTNRERFSVTVGEKLKSVHVDEIAYFYSLSGITFAVLFTKNQYSLDMSLDALKEQLNPNDFFRVNRQYLVRVKAINSVHIFPKSKLKIELLPPTTEEIFVSQEKVPEFKRWMDGEQ